MELEKLKASWDSLNETINKTETLNRKLIKEIINSKITTSHGKLVRKSIFDIVGLVISAIVIIWVFIPNTYNMFFVLSMTFVAFVLILNIINMCQLLKIDFSVKILSVQHQIVKYEKWLSAMYKIVLGASILFILALTLSMIQPLTVSTGNNMLGILIGFIAFLILGIFSYFTTNLEWKYEKKAITEMLKNINELKDIEE